MIALKKIYGDELLRLALILSLLNSNSNDIELESQHLTAGLFSNGSDWSIENEARTFIRPRYVHPKSLDSILLNYERRLFEDINSLGRYSEYNDRMHLNRGPIVQTYVLNDVATDTVAPALAEPTTPAPEETDSELPVEAVVTLTSDFLSNHSNSDLFDDLSNRSFDVEDFFVQNENMGRLEDEVRVKEEPKLYENEDNFDMYFETSRLAKDSVFAQNMADLRDYSDLEDSKVNIEVEEDLYDSKEDLQKFLLENTPLDYPVVVKKERASTSFTSTASSSGVSELDAETSDVKSEPEELSGDELTQEDMDLIEVLWKQDVDMGFCLDNVQNGAPQAAKVEFTDDLEKELKEKLELEKIEKVKASLLDEHVGLEEEDPWAGLSYTVDTETGEFVLRGELPGELVNSEESRFDFLEEALQLVELGEEDAVAKDEKNPNGEVEESGTDPSANMLHPAMARHALPHHHHPLAHYHNQTLMRSMSVEQRWQDLASLLTIPPPPDQYSYGHHPQQHPHNIGGHAAASGYTPNYGPIAPVPEKHPDAYGAPAPMDTSSYKVESAHHSQQHDGIYYQNTPGAPEMTNSDGFLQSILNDEDLQLMDMAMNEGMYTMRMLDGPAPGSAPHPPHPAPSHMTQSHMMIAERDSASDSAVSSMGSERVPSLSDGEWCDAGSDSAQEYHSSKFRPYDANFGRDRSGVPPNQPPQKKHHLFGKRCFQGPQPTNLEPSVPEPARAQTVIKYEYPEHQHHSYHPDNAMAMPNDYTPRHQAIPHHVHIPSIQPSLDLNSAHSSHALLQSNMNAHPVGRYSGTYSVDRVRHNHTYSAPLMNLEPRPASHRDKRVRRLTDGSMSDGGSTTNSNGHLTRDEKRAKALGIPLDVHDIINLPMDEFNERLSKHDLSEAQLSLIRDIRRRGKNKVAAQNCRKRKLDQITSLADEVRTVRDRKVKTQRDHQSLQAERQRVKERFAVLYRHVFQNLRDPDGRPLSSTQFSLQQAADGNVVLVPKMPQNDHQMNRTDDDMDRKAKHYDQ